MNKDNKELEQAKLKLEVKNLEANYTLTVLKGRDLNINFVFTTIKMTALSLTVAATAITLAVTLKGFMAQ